MKSLNLVVLLLLSSSSLAQRSIIGEQVVNSATGVKVLNVPAATLSAGLLSIDASGNLSGGGTTANKRDNDPSALTSLAFGSWATDDVFDIWDTSATLLKKTTVADFDGRYVLKSEYNTLFDTQLATKSTTNLAEGTNLYFTDGRAQTATISQTITNGVTTKAPSEDAVFDALALKQDAISETANTFAGFDNSGNLYSLPTWDFTDYVNGVSSIMTTDGSSQTSAERLRFQQNLGDGVSGDATTFTSITNRTELNANYVLSQYNGFQEFLLVDPASTLNGYAGSSVTIDGEVAGNSTLGYFSHVGDVVNETGVGVNFNGAATGNYQAFRADVAGTINGMYGLSVVNQADSTGQIELANLTNSGDITANNIIAINAYNSGDVGGQITGYGYSNDGESTQSITMFNGGNNSTGEFTNGLTGFNAYNQADGGATSNITGFQFSNTGGSQNFSGLSVNNSGVISDNIGLLGLTDTSNSPDSNAGAYITFSGTYDNVTALNISVDSATATGSPTNRKTGLAVNGGTLSAFIPFQTVSSLPSVVDGGHQLVTQFSVASGTPISDTSVLANNFSGLANFEDDFSGDPFYGLGYAMVGFVGQVGVATGKTVDKVSMAIGGASIPVSSTGGTVQNFVMFDSMGALPAGGTLTIDNLFGLKGESGMCTLATGCFGISIEDTAADNFLSKSLQVGGTRTSLDADTAILIGSKKAIGFTPMTSAEIAAIASPYESQLVYNGDDNEFNYYNGSAFTSLAGTPYVEPVVELKSANFTAAFNHIYITTNAIDVQLPAPVANKQIVIKISDGSTVNLIRNGSENIEGAAATYVLTSDRVSVTLVTDGTDWFII